MSKHHEPPPAAATPARAGRRVKRSTYHHGDLREALIEEGLRLLDRVGPRALSLRELAKLAGVTHSACYRHFANKEDLFSAIAARGFRRLAAAMSDEAARHRDPVAALRAMGLAYVRFAVASPAYFRAMFGGYVSLAARSGEMVEASEAALSLLRDGIVAAQEQGRVKRLPAEKVVVAAWALVHGLGMLLVDQQLEKLGLGADQAESLNALLVNFLVEGVGTTRA
jgi:AcrR family transcriptional regulator